MVTADRLKEVRMKKDRPVDQGRGRKGVHGQIPVVGFNGREESSGWGGELRGG